MDSPRLADACPGNRTILGECRECMVAKFLCLLSPFDQGLIWQMVAFERLQTGTHGCNGGSSTGGGAAGSAGRWRVGLGGAALQRRHGQSGQLDPLTVPTRTRIVLLDWKWHDPGTLCPLFPGLHQSDSDSALSDVLEHVLIEVQMMQKLAVSAWRTHLRL